MRNAQRRQVYSIPKWSTTLSRTCWSGPRRGSTSIRNCWPASRRTWRALLMVLSSLAPLFVLMGIRVTRRLADR